MNANTEINKKSAYTTSLKYTAIFSPQEKLLFNHFIFCSKSETDFLISSFYPFHLMPGIVIAISQATW